uniref:TEPSIN adaptor related protein complex 4 accessory protein n=1 Tax=Neogobius melanostomus TaxID=47308 RepID=A0A8C6THC8_9GOBI
MATFMERLSFLQKVPTLMKATADDESPCPGYLFQEIGKISHESLGYGQCLLEYLLERLQVNSCHVKLKVLKIFVHLCDHGSNHFLTELRRNSTFIQQASVYSGPPDPIHGTALYQKVRNTAQVRSWKAALLHGLTQRCPGQVGGGWEEADCANSSSVYSSQDVSAHSRLSIGSKSAGTGSQSGASKESSGDLSERVEALQLGDCVQEVALVCRITSGSRVFLSRDESLHFIKESSTLNCEVVVDLLSKKLQDSSCTRTLCALACLMTSDLLSLEQIFVVTQSELYQLSEGPPGPVANKATKLLRQFEALTCGSQHLQKQETTKSSHFTPNDFSSKSSDYLESMLPPPQVPQPLPTCVTQPLHEGPEGYAGTPEVKVRAGDGTVKTDSYLSASTLNRSDSGRLSLFTGMELVSKSRPMCVIPLCGGSSAQAEQEATMDTLKYQEENTDSDMNTIKTANTGLHSNSVSTDVTQTVSAFSFLNS